MPVWVNWSKDQNKMASEKIMESKSRWSNDIKGWTRQLTIGANRTSNCSMFGKVTIPLVMEAICRERVALDPLLNPNCTMSAQYLRLVLSKRLRESAMVRLKKERWNKQEMTRPRTWSQILKVALARVLIRYRGSAEHALIHLSLMNKRVLRRSSSVPQIQTALILQALIAKWSCKRSILLLKTNRNQALVAVRNRSERSWTRLMIRHTRIKTIR